MRLFVIALGLLTSASAFALTPAESQALNECRAGKPFLLYDAEVGIVDALQQLEDAQDGMKHARTVSAASGVRNLSVEYEYGSRITGARDLLADSWKQYRAAGGKARSAKEVRVNGTDPCANP